MTQAAELAQFGSLVGIASGNVGIGTNSPSFRLDAVNNVAGLARYSFSNPNAGMTQTDLRVGAGTNSNDVYFGVISGNGFIDFRTTNNVMVFQNSGSERMRIDSSGNLLVGVNSATANGGILQLSSGITFPAAQVAASNLNTLDDYEEGTFSPTVEGSTATGTATYSVQVGRYTKIGNRVYFNLYVVYSGGTGTGNLRIGSLPFISNSTTNNFSSFSCYLGGVALTASNLGQCYVGNTSAAVIFEQYPVGGGSATFVAYDAAASIIVSGHYEV